jgi:hypothetical protein
MAEILAFKTPGKGSSSIGVEKSDRGSIVLKFKREMGEGMVVSETIVVLSSAQAVEVAKAVLIAAEKGIVIVTLPEWLAIEKGLV